MMDFQKVTNLIVEASSYISIKNLNTIKVKGEADYVTDVDLAINNFLKDKLRKINGSIGFFSEEEEGQLSDPCWILDPIDGTTNLIFGYKMTSISLALFSNGEISFGAVYDPFNKELFTAVKDKGAFLNGKKLHVSLRTIKDSMIEFGVVSTNKENIDIDFEIAKYIYKNCMDIRRTCSAALNLCYIAASRLDGYFSTKIEPWDIAAGALIVSEAGGKITCHDGSKILLSASTSAIASNGIIHEFLQQAVKY
jgi:myo-inositol-1(or 4)-monophosphatase